MYRSLNLLSNDIGAKQFKENSRNYNNGLSFSSVGFTMDPSVYGPQGVYTFRIQGELYHLMGSLLPADGQDPAFAQIYIYDSNQEYHVDIRLAYTYNRLDCATYFDLTH